MDQATEASTSSCRLNRSNGRFACHAASEHRITTLNAAKGREYAGVDGYAAGVMDFDAREAKI
jgi:hypothetical protein